MMKENKIHIVKNFTANEIFITLDKFEKKFNKPDPLKILYVSGMRNKKGYKDLLDGFIQLNKSKQDEIEIDFAGEFETDGERLQFTNTIKEYPNLKYHGVINDDIKTNLFHASHVFCLPTKYMEGQPISILEAYASGCCVLTTSMGGIVDIFESNKNGLKVEPGDIDSISRQMEFCLAHFDSIKKMAQFNLDLAKKNYKKDVFLTLTSDVILNKN
jgi:glycosyltransferase involved in cell wall biosynthesis